MAKKVHRLTLIISNLIRCTFSLSLFIVSECTFRREFLRNFPYSHSTYLLSHNSQGSPEKLCELFFYSFYWDIDNSSPPFARHMKDAFPYFLCDPEIPWGSSVMRGENILPKLKISNFAFLFVSLEAFAQDEKDFLAMWKLGQFFWRNFWCCERIGDQMTLWQIAYFISFVVFRVADRQTD
jgi:hypothetical protein